MTARNFDNFSPKLTIFHHDTYHLTNHHNRFTAPFPGPLGWAGAGKRAVVVLK